MQGCHTPPPPETPWYPPHRPPSWDGPVLLASPMRRRSATLFPVELEGSLQSLWAVSRIPIPIGPQVAPFWGLPYRILNINHKKELLRGLWVTLNPIPWDCGSFARILFHLMGFGGRDVAWDLSNKDSEGSGFMGLWDKVWEADCGKGFGRIRAYHNLAP